MKNAIAIIDDDPGMLRSIGRLLEAHGYKHFAFESAEEFLDEQDRLGAQCLIVDIHLNGISGIELARRLVGSGENIPLIFITAADDPATYAEAIEIGCVALLPKPFSATSLIGAIKKAHTNPIL